MKSWVEKVQDDLMEYILSPEKKEMYENIIERNIPKRKLSFIEDRALDNCLQAATLEIVCVMYDKALELTEGED